MSTPTHHPDRRCDGVLRRDVLRIASLTSLGLSLPGWLRSRRVPASETSTVKQGRAKAAILIWLDGGPSHLETFDPKPDAPAEVRGPFQPIATAVAGIHVCELLPEMARRMKDIALIRSMTSPLGEHNLGTHYLLTGYHPTPALQYPSIGAVAAHFHGGRQTLPPYIAVPDHRVGGGKFAARGYLGARCEPFSVGADPANADFQVRHLDLWPEMTLERVERRKKFLQALDGWQQSLEQQKQSSEDPDFDQAYRMVTSRAAKAAFRLEDEPAAVRQKYGTRTVGQSCLLARRLVEHGVPFVTVNYRGWDTHQNLYTQLKEGYTGAKVPVGLIPSLDLAVSALIDDLNQRAMLDETLVIVMGEFGRTPKLNTSGGRDHWPRVFSIAVAGGGVRGGQIIGNSDRTGESPYDRPVTPADFLATIYTLLGIDPAQTLYTPDQRPVRVNADGKIIAELLA